MPILIICGILAGCGVVGFVNSCKTNAKPKSKTQSEYIADQMIGKSKSECKKILRRYR